MTDQWFSTTNDMFLNFFTHYSYSKFPGCYGSDVPTTELRFNLRGRVHGLHDGPISSSVTMSPDAAGIRPVFQYEAIPYSRFRAAVPEYGADDPLMLYSQGRSL